MVPPGSHLAALRRRALGDSLIDTLLVMHSLHGRLADGDNREQVRYESPIS